MACTLRPTTSSRRDRCSANLVTGLGVSVAGLVTMAADRGRLLRAGLSGIVFSLPERAFFNIRKGSLLFAPHP